jgi:hypothetical protein
VLTTTALAHRIPAGDVSIHCVDSRDRGDADTVSSAAPTTMTGARRCGRPTLAYVIYVWQHGRAERRSRQSRQRRACSTRADSGSRSASTTP